MTRLEKVVVALEILLAIGAYGGAIGLLGGFIDFAESTERLPWGSLTFAGFALGLILGVFPTIVVVAAVRNPGSMRLWHLLVGLTVCGWIVVQVAFIGLGSWLQYFYFFYGVAIVWLAWFLSPPIGRVEVGEKSEIPSRT